MSVWWATWTMKTSVPGPSMSVYQPLEQGSAAAVYLCITKSDPYGAVAADHELIRDMSTDQTIEKAARWPTSVPRS